MRIITLPCRLSPVLRLLVANVLCISFGYSAQASPQDSTHTACMVLIGQGYTGGFSLPGTYQNGSLQSCPGSSGRLRAYFEDVQLGTGAGFDDLSQGADRQACVCAVLSYIESVIDINPAVTAANPLIITFAQATTFTPIQLISTVAPNYSGAVPGYNNSYMQEAIIHGGAGLPTQSCGVISINFADPFTYCQTTTISGCTDDFFGVVLHDVTHLLGFASAIHKATWSGGILYPPGITASLGANTFTTFDEQFLYYKNGSTLSKVVTGTGASAAISPAAAATLATSSDILWLNSDPLATTRTNQPIADEGDIGTDINRSFNHLVEDFTLRGWESPGFAVPYIMDDRIKPGYLRRKYSLQELRVLLALGYTPNPAYTDWAKVSNTPAYTLGPVVTNFTGAASHLTNIPPAGNSDLYITTTSGHIVTVTLNGSATTAGTVGSISGWDPATNAAISHGLGLKDD